MCRGLQGMAGSMGTPEMQPVLLSRHSSKRIWKDPSHVKVDNFFYCTVCIH